MSPEPVRWFVLTPHARLEMQRRGLAIDVVRDVLDPGKTYVVRVFVDVDRRPNEVVTAYRSSQIAKYWRREP